MTLYIIDKNPRICAESLDDLKLNFAIIETAKVLCTVYPKYNALYNPPKEHEDVWYPEINTEFTDFANFKLYNYMWLCSYFHRLGQEKRYRSNKDHVTYAKFKKIFPFPDMFDISKACFKDLDTIDSYKRQLNLAWNISNKSPKWSRKNSPLWFINLRND